MATMTEAKGESGSGGGLFKIGRAAAATGCTIETHRRLIESDTEKRAQNGIRQLKIESILIGLSLESGVISRICDPQNRELYANR
jgi:hypothetical protein